MSYFNTTASAGRELAEFRQKAAAQEVKVLDWFLSHPNETFTPEDIGECVLPGTPRTSWGRALSNLTKAGMLEKTDKQTIGAWGRPVYHWRLVPQEPVQTSILDLVHNIP